MTMLAIRDVSLFVKTMGHGHPLLLMHGGPGLDHTTLAGLEPLSDQYTLVFYDHRANGRSTGAATTMTWDNLVADAEALRESLGYDRWSVLGHSFGGQVALEYALRHEAHIAQLVLFDTCAEMRWYRDSAPTILGKRGYKPAAVRAARRFFTGDLEPDEVLPTVRKFMGAYFSKWRIRDVPRSIAGAFRLKMRPEAHVFGFRTLMKHWSVMDRLGEITVPTLVLSGRDDFLFPPEHQAIIADRIPHARLEIIEHAGHNPYDERRGEVLRILRQFLGARHPAASVEQPEDAFAGVV